jgi:hypothetical protein
LALPFDFEIGASTVLDDDRANEGLILGCFPKSIFFPDTISFGARALSAAEVLVAFAALSLPAAADFSAAAGGGGIVWTAGGVVPVATAEELL